MEKVSSTGIPIHAGEFKTPADDPRAQPLAGLPIVGSVLAGIVASLCCVGPLALVMLGAGGAWASNLTLLEPLRPVFVGVAVLAMGFAAKKLFFTPQVCVPGTPCADPRALRNQRIVFVVVAVALAALLAFPLYAHWFY